MVTFTPTGVPLCIKCLCSQSHLASPRNCPSPAASPPVLRMLPGEDEEQGQQRKRPILPGFAQPEAPSDLGQSSPHHQSPPPPALTHTRLSAA